MALTKITRGLLNTGVSDSSDATAITIDSSEKVGIGTTSPNSIFHIKTQDSTVGQNAGAGFHILNHSDASYRVAQVWLNADGGEFGFSNTTGNYAYLEKRAHSSGNGELRLFNGDNAPIEFWTRAASGQGFEEKAQIDASGNLKFNSGYGSVATAFGVRAWVRFRGDTSGTGNRQVDGSGNVSSVGYVGTGRYRMNFNNSMPDVHYAVAAAGVGVTNHNPMSASIDYNYSTNVGYVDLAYGPSGGANSTSLATNSGALYNAIVVR